MRLVLDTNVVVAGLLWHGPPRRLLDHAIDGAVTLYASTALLDELAHTLGYAKFAARITRAETSREALVARYDELIERVTPVPLPQAVSRDPDDDQVLACALAAQAEAIVSGDSDLLDLKSFQGIAIVTAAQAVERISGAK